MITVNEEVRVFLQNINMGMYATMLISKGFDTVENLVCIEQSDLLDLGIPLGHARRILYELSMKKQNDIMNELNVQWDTGLGNLSFASLHDVEKIYNPEMDLDMDLDMALDVLLAEKKCKKERENNPKVYDLRERRSPKRKSPNVPKKNRVKEKKKKSKKDRVKLKKPISFEVDQILAHEYRNVESKVKIFYKLRWKGYDDSHDTWEPIESFLEGNTKLITYNKEHNLQ